MSDARPIGVVASGAGGLVVAERLRTALPKEDLVVLSDDFHAPYAALPSRIVARRLSALAEAVVSDGVKILLLASLQGARDLDGSLARLPVPLETLDGALEAGARTSTTDTILAVSGAGCTRGSSYARGNRRLRGGIGIVTLELPGLREGSALVRTVSERALEVGAGAIVLVCPHACALAASLPRSEALPVIDATALAAARIRRRLLSGGELAQRRRQGRTILASSAPARAQEAIGRAYLQRPGRTVAKPAM